MFRLLSCSAGLAALALAAAPAQAGAARVLYHDLDLSTQAGVKTLESRVRNAAREVCDFDGYWKSRRMITSQTCVVKAMREARPQMETAINLYGQRIRRAEAESAAKASS